MSGPSSVKPLNPSSSDISTDTAILLTHAVRSLGVALCHDFASPLTALMTGIDLLRTTKNPHEIYALVDKSLAILRRNLEIIRKVYAAPGDCSMGESLYSLIQNYAKTRQELTLTWEVDPRKENNLSPKLWRVLPAAFTCFLHVNPRVNQVAISPTSEKNTQGLSLSARAPESISPDFNRLCQGLSAPHHLMEIKNPDCMMLWLVCQEQGLKLTCTSTQENLRITWESPAV